MGTKEPTITVINTLFSMKQEYKAGELIRITSRNTKLQPHVKLGDIYAVESTDTTGKGATVLVVHNAKMKYGTMRINSQRFGWEHVTMQQLKAEKKEAQFKQAVKTDVQRILEAFTVQEHMEITFVPLVLNEIAWELARKAMELAARDRVSDLRKLNRVLKELRQYYERTVCKDLLPSDFDRLHRQSMQFMQEHAYNFQILYYTASNVFSKQYHSQPFEEMRVNALLAMLIIRYTDEHNKRCDKMLEQRLGKITAAKRMPAMDSLYTGMEAFAGELPEPFNFADNNLQMCMGILRNTLKQSEWIITREPNE